MVTAYNNTAIILFLVVFHQILDTIERFPTASGLVVAFTNKICPRAKRELQNIETSAQEISSAFHNLGCPSCIFHECVKAKFVAVFKALSERIDFPSSYKMLFTYFAGHGKKDCIGLQDGYVSINTIKELFESDRDQIRHISKVLFLDCCRKLETNEPIRPSVENLLIINCTRLHRKAYLMNEEGMGVGTSEFLNALCTRNNCSFTDIVTQFIAGVKMKYREIEQSGIDLPKEDYSSLWPDYEGCLDQVVNLYHERLIGCKFINFMHTNTKKF